MQEAWFEAGLGVEALWVEAGQPSLLCGEIMKQNPGFEKILFVLTIDGLPNTVHAPFFPSIHLSSSMFLQVTLEIPFCLDSYTAFRAVFTKAMLGALLVSLFIVQVPSRRTPDRNLPKKITLNNHWNALYPSEWP